MLLVDLELFCKLSIGYSSSFDVFEDGWCEFVF
jgi:hypothetical protein